MTDFAAAFPRIVKVSYSLLLIFVSFSLSHSHFIATIYHAWSFDFEFFFIKINDLLNKTFTCMQFAYYGTVNENELSVWSVILFDLLIGIQIQMTSSFFYFSFSDFCFVLNFSFQKFKNSQKSEDEIVSCREMIGVYLESLNDFCYIFIYHPSILEHELIMWILWISRMWLEICATTDYRHFELRNHFDCKKQKNC